MPTGLDHGGQGRHTTRSERGYGPPCIRCSARPMRAGMRDSSVTDASTTDGDRDGHRRPDDPRAPLRDATGVVDQVLLNEHLPLGVLVVDKLGVVRHVNRRATSLTGYAADEVMGRSIVEFIEPADVDFLISSLTFAAHDDDAVMGPSRVRFRHRDGEIRWTEYWACDCPPSFGFEGYIVTITPESVTDNLANAAFQIASDRPLPECLGELARAVTSYPLVATGTMVVRADRLSDAGTRNRSASESRLSLIGHWPSAVVPYVSARAMPWHDVFDTGESRDLEVDELPEPVREAAIEAGYRSIWVRPVTTRQSTVAAALVAWRYEAGAASPNQERHLDEVVGLARLAFDNDEHRRQLELAATTDPLTGLGNRAGLARRLREVEGEHISVLYVDLDGFKRVNDTYGHGVGDSVIVAAGQRLVSILRDTDSVYRVGGDEFVVVCRDISDEQSSDAAAQIASRIVEKLGAPFRVDDALVSLGASVGVALRSGEENATELLRRADLALLSAKRDGKARWISAPISSVHDHRS
jgi:diguanylate cyclase (GGDEF)-like protein/PAS domain S-box-containing protein